MASVYQEKGVWYVRLKNIHGVWKRARGFPAKGLTQELLHKLERCRDAYRAGAAPSDELRQWLDRQPAEDLKRHADKRLIDPAWLNTSDPSPPNWRHGRANGRRAAATPGISAKAAPTFRPSWTPERSPIGPP